MQNLYKFLFINLFILIIFWGCTPPSAFSFFKEDELKATAFQYTNSSKLILRGEIKALINVTYLNSVDDDFDDDKQNFLIGLFISDNENNESLSLNNDKYFITLNDVNATYVSTLSDQHKMYGHIPMYNNWAKYHLVKFDTDENNETLTINLKYKINKANKNNTNFYLKTPTIVFEAE